MSSIKNLGMADAILSSGNITINKSFFGLLQKAIYTPTQSPVKIITQEYSATDGERLERLLSLPTDRLNNELQANGKPSAAQLGHYRVEACVSDDHQFCAVQLFRFVDLVYTPVSEPVIREGRDAEVLTKIL